MSAPVHEKSFNIQAKTVTKYRKSSKIENPSKKTKIYTQSACQVQASHP
jgi:hypothetical protein